MSFLFFHNIIRSIAVPWYCASGWTFVFSKLLCLGESYRAPQVRGLKTARCTSTIARARKKYLKTSATAKAKQVMQAERVGAHPDFSFTVAANPTGTLLCIGSSLQPGAVRLYIKAATRLTHQARYCFLIHGSDTFA